MLLRFSVENFRSFNEEVTLNLIPVQSRIHPRHIQTSDAKGRTTRSLPLAVLYGANASGKSNLIRAIAFAQKLIIGGTRGESPTGTEPFRLDPDAVNKPSRFEFVIKHDDVLYTYGFVLTNREVQEEWLFAVYHKQEQRLFERVTENGKARTEFGNALASTREEKQRLQFVAAGARPNQLFLTEAVDRNVETLKPLMTWFRDRLTIIWPGAMYAPLVLRAHTDHQFAGFLSSFLAVADTGIQGIDIKSEELEPERHFQGLVKKDVTAMLDELNKSTDRALVLGAGESFFALRQVEHHAPEFLTLQTRHRSSDGATVSFDPRDESDGTYRMMHMAPALLDMQSTEKVYVIDELDRSLHPHLSRLYIEAFLRGVSEGGHRGQLILTTHETALLDLNLLRRDEIWFMEKDQSDASHLTSLAEFKYKVHADLKIDKGYLAGRFGAIPYVGDTRVLIRPGASA